MNPREAIARRFQRARRRRRFLTELAASGRELAERTIEAARPDSPGGERITQAEAEQLVELAGDEFSDLLWSLLHRFGLVDSADRPRRAP